MSDIMTSQQLLAQLRGSDDRKAALVAAYQRYFYRLVALLKKRLAGPLQHKADADDLAQSAWGSFIDGLARNNLDLEGRDSLWPLLALIAIRKYQDLNERFRTRGRDIAREQSMSAGNADSSFDPHGASPTPVEDLAVQETIELLQTRLGDDKQQQILILRLQGYSVEELADKVSLSVRTVKRVLQKVRDLYEELFPEEE